MKKILAAFILLILAGPLSAQAHTGLSSSNPAEGEKISAPLKEITLIFETQIEAGSTMVLAGAGQTFTLDEIMVSGDTLQGQLSEKELPNGAYEIQWTIIGADGHPIKGEVGFEVAMEIDSSEAAIEESPAEEDIPVEKTEPIEKAAVSDTTAQPESKEGSLMGTILISILAIAIAGIAYKVFKMKK
ncbi:copper resistance protein CopC [Planococcus sp. APC 3906]|uniref:copper resistance CopC family protein n=1 Tax=Planococcus sp. APC 3906 TaxID=3035194 RepID=UPI0025B59FFB|nr:copper resistance CopC family protein [Planococcus sp. APC 3906]MDN3449386.1 copper resistance protein CopC [Planococcus sp. APC 3906]